MIRSAADKHALAAVILQTRSFSGTAPLYTDVIGGGTNLFGEQIGFFASITATPKAIVIDISFNPFTGNALVGDAPPLTMPLPPDVRVELDDSGTVAVSPMSESDRLALADNISKKRALCTAMLGFMALRIPGLL